MNRWEIGQMITDELRDSMLAADIRITRGAGMMFERYESDTEKYANRPDTEGYRAHYWKLRATEKGIELYRKVTPFVGSFVTTEFVAVLPDGRMTEPQMFESDAYRKACSL